MSVAWAFDAVLAVTVLAAAGWSVAARDTLSAVVGFVAYGLLLALVWVRIAAPDVALTEAAIGGGVTGVLLLGAAAHLRGVGTPTWPGAPLRIVTAVLCAAVAAALAAAVLLLPQPAPSLAPAAVADLPALGVGNPITGVLMGYRALDTLLEKVVLVLALIGVWSLAPDSVWGGAPGLQRPGERDAPLVFLAGLLPPLGIVIGVYLVWVGKDEPGGAFQGGALLAAMWLLAIMAGLSEVAPTSRRWLRVALVVGPLVFLAIGLAGVALAGAFLAYPQAYATALIIIIEVVLTLSIAATLGLLVAGPPARVPPR